MNDYTALLTEAKENARTLSAKAMNAGYEYKGLHVYADEMGKPVYWKVRLKLPEGFNNTRNLASKWIRSMSCVDGSWALKEPNFRTRYPAGGGKKPLYNLAALTNDNTATVYITEGEQKADALNELGLLATTTGGSSSVNTVMLAVLAGRNIVIWPDNDQAGTKYADNLCQSLTLLSCSIEIIDLNPLNLPPKGDVMNWLELHPAATKSDVEGLKRISHNDWMGLNLRTPEQGKADLKAKVNLQCMADVVPEKIQWLWYGWLPKGKLTILAGAGGTGKTTMAISIAAALTVGGKLPDKTNAVGKHNVLIWSGEDDIADTIAPRLLAAGADMSRVFTISGVELEGETTYFDFTLHIRLLEDAINNVGGISLIIVDPIVSAVTGDMNKANDVRKGLAPLVHLAEKHQCAVLGITHFGKGGQGKAATERVIGSQAFTALARLVWVAAKDDAVESQSVLARTKSNISIDSGGCSYNIEPVTIHNGIETTRTAWGELVEGTANEILRTVEGDQFTPEQCEVETILLEILADGEKHFVADIQAQVKELGFSSFRKFDRASTKLKVKKAKTSDFPSRAYWQLKGGDIDLNTAPTNIVMESVACVASVPKTLGYSELPLLTLTKHENDSNPLKSTDAPHLPHLRPHNDDGQEGFGEMVI